MKFSASSVFAFKLFVFIVSVSSNFTSITSPYSLLTYTKFALTVFTLIWKLQITGLVICAIRAFTVSNDLDLIASDSKS